MANATKALTHKAISATPRTYTLGALAECIGARLEGDPDLPISGVGTLANAKPGEMTFLAGAKYRAYLAQTRAAAVILAESELEHCPQPALVCSDPKLAFAQVVSLLYPHETVATGIHPTAIISASAVVDPLCSIGPYCVIGDNTTIEKGVIIGSHCSIGSDCRIGAGTVLYTNISIYAQSRIGENCVIHSGVVIGGDGFGFAKQQDRWLKVPHVAGVQIGDRVEIGACTTIDRGVIEDTTIGDDVILDNLIQIGHNVKVGDGTAMAGKSGIAGSTEVGKHCMIGGATSINGHIKITDHVNIVGCSNVPKTITEPGTYASATTIMEFKRWKKILVRYHQLEEMAQRITALEKQLEKK